MIARVAWGKVRPGTWQDYERVYHDAILPDTRNLRGLVFRELLQAADDPNEGISLTLWESRDDLDTYEQSEVYQRPVDRAGVPCLGVPGQALRGAAGRGAQALGRRSSARRVMPPPRCGRACRRAERNGGVMNGSEIVLVDDLAIRGFTSLLPGSEVRAALATVARAEGAIQSGMRRPRPSCSP